MYNIIHLVPYDYIGGVEVAARTMMDICDGDLSFRVKYICNKKKYDECLKDLYNPKTLLKSVRYFLGADVDVLIVSLWRSSIVGIIVKILRPKTKLITFLHQETDAHIVDFMSTRISLLLSSVILADSRATMSGRLSQAMAKRCKVISFLTRHINSLPCQKVSPVFIFWGRLHPRKGVERSLMIFSAIQKHYSDARFMIIGPDGGAMSDIKKCCDSLGLGSAVKFSGSATFEEIVAYARSASFFLQTSQHEGMCISIVESMQLGLVPVVTAVGEIGSYCKHNHNSVIIDSDEIAVKDVLRLLSSNEQYQLLRSNAIESWKGIPTYRDSVIDACRDLLLL